MFYLAKAASTHPILFNDLNFYFAQILSLYEAKSLGKYLAQIFSFIKGQYLAQIKIQIVKQIGCVDAALAATLKTTLEQSPKQVVTKLNIALLQ